MERPLLPKVMGLLAEKQLRRENKAILDRMNSLEKAIADMAAGKGRNEELLRQELAALAQELKENKENTVAKQEFEAYKLREQARENMDRFLATGDMGEQEKAAAEQRIAARAERHHAVNKSPIFLTRLQSVETQLVPSVEPYKSPFFQAHENRPQGTIAEPTMAELRSIAGEASPQPSDDEDDDDSESDIEVEDHYYDDGYDDYWNKKGGLSKQVPHNLAHGHDARSGHGERYGEKQEGRVIKDVGAGVDERTATVTAKPVVRGQPSKVPSNNQYGVIRSSHYFAKEGQQKRSHEEISKVSLRVDEHRAEQEHKKSNNPPPAKRPRVSDYTPPELVYGHRPQTRSTASEQSIQPPPPPHKPITKLAPHIKKLSFKPVEEAITKPIANPGPKLQLPRLMQGKTPMAKYYKEANEAFSIFPHKDERGQEEFVNHFLAGIFGKNERNVAIQQLQQSEDCTVKNKRPWIQCEWKKVLKSLLAAKLFTKKDLA